MHYIKRDYVHFFNNMKKCEFYVFYLNCKNFKTNKKRNMGFIFSTWIVKILRQKLKKTGTLDIFSFLKICDSRVGAI